MSVMCISLQMIGDAVKKAQTFRNFGYPSQEEMMCRTLGQINKDDAMRNEKKVEELFARLYRWNAVSYEAKYENEENYSTHERLQYEFEESGKIAKEIDIYQFILILDFLDYNIESDEVRGKNILPEKEMLQMESDVELLQKIIRETKAGIVRALQEEKKCKWFYY